MSDTYARYIVGDAMEVLASMPDASVDCVITSPPYHLQRSYLLPGDPLKAKEIGQEGTPAEFIDVLLDVMDELWRVLADHGTYWINLGDKHAGSGGSGGDYDPDGDGLRPGQPKFDSTAAAERRRYKNDDQDGGPMRDRALDEAEGRIPPGSGARWKEKPGWPLDQSVAWEPHLFAASLAYGRNLLNGNEHRQWITRPPITWCKPSVSPGALTRRFRTATELIVYGGKRTDHYFDLDAVRETPTLAPRVPFALGQASASRGIPGGDSGNPDKPRSSHNPAGSPPLNWWVIGHGEGYSGAHFATFPPALLEKPIRAGCPAKVCLDCARPVVRLVESRYVDQPDDRTRRKGHGRLSGVDNPPEKGWERERETVGWSCGCPANGERARAGVVLDCFAGTFVTGLVASGHGRSAIGIDLDARNADLARDRLGWLLTDVTVHGAPTTTPEAQGPQWSDTFADRPVEDVTGDQAARVLG